MSIYETAVRKPITTALIYVAIAVLGLFALSRLSIELMPKTETTNVMVVTSYPVPAPRISRRTSPSPLRTRSMVSTVSSILPRRVRIIPRSSRWSSALVPPSLRLRMISVTSSMRSRTICLRGLRSRRSLSSVRARSPWLSSRSSPRRVPLGCQAAGRPCQQPPAAH